MKNQISIFLENAVSLIPQQSLRFIVYSLLTVGIVKGFKIARKQIINKYYL
ncbi:MAG: hypothetical protein AABX23_01235 [Nanoarchaeota archaeon]